MRVLTGLHGALLEWLVSQLRIACGHWSALYREPNTGDDVGVCCTLRHQAEVVNEAFFEQLEEILCSHAWCLWGPLIIPLHLEEKTHEGTGSRLGRIPWVMELEKRRVQESCLTFKDHLIQAPLNV